MTAVAWGMLLVSWLAPLVIMIARLGSLEPFKRLGAIEGETMLRSLFVGSVTIGEEAPVIRTEIRSRLRRAAAIMNQSSSTVSGSGTSNKQDVGRGPRFHFTRPGRDDRQRHQHQKTAKGRRREAPTASSSTDRHRSVPRLAQYFDCQAA